LLWLFLKSGLEFLLNLDCHPPINASCVYHHTQLLLIEVGSC
jgi:hypothetical protein